MIIAHMCECGHRSWEHERTHCKWYAGCRCSAPQYGPSEIVPTFDASGETVERIVEPGDGLRSFGHGVFSEDGKNVIGYTRPGMVLVAACHCDECKALYATTGGAA